jgi:protoporphyrinogen oxidase
MHSNPDRQMGILGAGASGLSFALLADADCVIIEKDHRPGGHAASSCVDGWVFDQGPHIMFSRDQLSLDCMVASLGKNVHRSRRNNKVAVAGSLAGYPLESLFMSWADRISQPPMEAVIRGAFGERSEGYLHQLFYSYPLRGGYSALMNAWASGIRPLARGTARP